MKYIIPSLFIMILLIQCTKDKPNPRNTNNIFSVTPDPNYLLDTLTISTRTGNEINYGYFFSYDNFNRVTTIKRYEFFFNMPTNMQGTWTFNYQGTSNNPESMDQVSYNNYRVYFIYNADGSKNRDSIVSSVDPVVRAVRKYVYDSAFNYVVARLYYKGSLKASLLDSAIFKNYNCSDIYSNELTWTGNIPYSYETFHNYYSQVDNHPNPFSKMNIFPALFFAPYLHLGYNVDGAKWRGGIVGDFAFQNNLGKYKFYDYATGGYNYIFIDNVDEDTYDSKNRISRKDFVDSTGSVYNMNFSNRYYATYKYR